MTFNNAMTFVLIMNLVLVGIVVLLSGIILSNSANGFALSGFSFQETKELMDIAHEQGVAAERINHMGFMDVHVRSKDSCGPGYEDIICDVQPTGYAVELYQNERVVYNATTEHGHVSFGYIKPGNYTVYAEGAKLMYGNTDAQRKNFTSSDSLTFPVKVISTDYEEIGVGGRSLWIEFPYKVDIKK